jgi:hypothetical protein
VVIVVAQAVADVGAALGVHKAFEQGEGVGGGQALDLEAQVVVAHLHLLLAGAPVHLLDADLDVSALDVLQQGLDVLGLLLVGVAVGVHAGQQEQQLHLLVSHHLADQLGAPLRVVLHGLLAVEGGGVVQEAAGGEAVAVVEAVDDGLAVQQQGQALPHAHVVEGEGAAVDVEEVGDAGVAHRHVVGRIAVDLRGLGGGDGAQIAQALDLAGPQGGVAGLGVGDDLEAEGLGDAGGAPVVIVALDDAVLAQHVLGHHVGAGADGEAGEGAVLGEAGGLEDGGAVVDHGVVQQGLALGEREHHGVIVGLLVGDQAGVDGVDVHAVEGGLEGPLLHAVEVGQHAVGVEGSTVGEGDSLPQMEGPHGGVLVVLPLGGQGGGGLAALVLGDQGLPHAQGHGGVVGVLLAGALVAGGGKDDLAGLVHSGRGFAARRGGGLGIRRGRAAAARQGQGTGNGKQQRQGALFHVHAPLKLTDA